MQRLSIALAPVSLVAVCLAASPALAGPDGGPSDVAGTADAVGDATGTADIDAGVTSPGDATSTADGDSKPEVQPGANSCAGRCGKYDKNAKCQCDLLCAHSKYNDCCPDRDPVCKGTCGNGFCEPSAGEDPTKCKEDCEFKTSNQCIMEKCAKEGKACMADDGCAGLMICAPTVQQAKLQLSDCKQLLGISDDQMGKGTKLFEALSTCAKQCKGSNSGGSCKDRCDKYEQDASCQCDKDCKDPKYDDCCSDYDQLCGKGTTCEPKCDGKECGPDGCGGTCGSCTAPAQCDFSGKCITPAKPDTASRTAAPDAIADAGGSSSGGASSGGASSGGASSGGASSGGASSGGASSGGTPRGVAAGNSKGNGCAAGSGDRPSTATVALLLLGLVGLLIRRRVRA